ncbi:P-loop containing nucleoside triphosphate hydrolase [Gracilaria domingensis]|nr:P-loop containing nucleoside triphosphate hydrolase [Gracilaria domingensis]
MAEFLIVDLMAKGMLAVIGHKFENTGEAINATKSEIVAMKGILENFRSQMDSELHCLNEGLRNVHKSILAMELRLVKDQMLKYMEPVNDNDIRERLLAVSMVLYCLTQNTKIEEVSIQTDTVLLPASSSVDGHHQEVLRTITETIKTTTSTKEMMGKIMKLDREGLFSEVQHRTDEPLNIIVSAAAKRDAVKEDLIIGTGALYMLCQTLCSTIQDNRGVHASAREDISFARSDSEINRNACHISLRYVLRGLNSHASPLVLTLFLHISRYYWPSPVEFKRVEDLLSEPVVDRLSNGKFETVFEAMQEKVRIRNVYLLGETGEGKSTLGNVLTGTKNFYVSHAGTGTVTISGNLVEEAGLLKGQHEIMVWDTPGMNDREGRDKIYESMLYQHLTRENTVSTIVIVSKDGCRTPASLIHTMNVYRQAFGDSFASCVCVCMGLSKNQWEQGTLDLKRQLWMDLLSEQCGISESTIKERIFFYNAKDSSPQEDGDKLRDLILNSKVRLTGAGSTILHGLKKMKEAELNIEEKKAMFKASEEEFVAIREELRRAQRVRTKRFRNHRRKVTSLCVEILPVMAARILPYCKYYILRRQNEGEEKVIVFEAYGERAVELLSEEYLKNREVNHWAKVNILVTKTREKNLILVNMGSHSRQARRGKIQEQRYRLLHLEDTVDAKVFKEVDDILAEMVGDPTFVTAFGTFFSQEDLNL